MGWGIRVADPDRFQRMIEEPNRHLVALDHKRIVGFGRALCDGVSNGYLSMVAVAPDYRRKGVGRELVRLLMGDDPEITWVLRSGRGTDGFWEKLGFKASTIAMERVRFSENREA